MPPEADFVIKGDGKTTLRAALRLAVEHLEAAGVPDAEADAEYLLCHVLGSKRHELFMNQERILSSVEAEKFSEFVTRKAAREPAQYITGVVEFMGHSFRVTRDTLIPRPETELLVVEAAKAVSSGRTGPGRELTAIELCAGSGCVAVSVALEVPGCRVYSTDISEAALTVARENAAANNVSGRVVFLRGDLYGPLRGMGLERRAELILANPPYVADADYMRLEPEVRYFEPPVALMAGPDGLRYITAILGTAPEFLAPDGTLLMEFGYGQAEGVAGLAEESGLMVERVIKDLSGIDRILKARLR